MTFKSNVKAVYVLEHAQNKLCEIGYKLYIPLAIKYLISTHCLFNMSPIYYIPIA